MKLNEVTWYSRLGALILFIFIIPSLSFYIGRQYESTVQAIEKPVEVVPVVVTHAATTQSATKVKTTE